MVQAIRCYFVRVVAQQRPCTRPPRCYLLRSRSYLRWVMGTVRPLHTPFSMTIAVQIYPVMPTRPCSFCLCLQGGSVFADFDTDEASIISLRRVSFDGYGCCEVEPTTRMSSGDSRLLLDAITHGELESVQVEALCANN